MPVHMPTQPIEDMVALIGSADFGAEFFRICDAMIGIDHCTALICTDTGPKTIVAQAQPLLQSNVPARKLGAAGRSPAQHRPQHRAEPLAPAQTQTQTQTQEGHIRPNMRHELALTGQLKGDQIYLAFYRDGQRGAFTPDAVELLELWGKMIALVLHKHAECVAPTGPRPDVQPPSAPVMFERVRQALLAENSRITPREAEICASIIMGYTVVGISLRLGITTNTVVTHRKRAYAKLQISSQNELFARYFSAVEHGAVLPLAALPTDGLPPTPEARRLALTPRR